MVISKTPLRISFVGGGSDLGAFCNRHTGAVVSTTINKFIYITVNKKFDNRIRVSYSATENVAAVSAIKHHLIRECLKLLKIRGGIEITSISDIPSRGTGLGSSSSYVVGLLNALHAYLGKPVSQEQLAEEACWIEIEILGKPIGKQDQYSAAFGGLNYIEFHRGGRVSVAPLSPAKSTLHRLEENLLLFYSGIQRSAEKVLAEQVRNIKLRDEAEVGLQKMAGLARQMRLSLQTKQIGLVGKLLQENWQIKKSLAGGISTPEIDRWYDRAVEKGAISGKVLGAGGGGFLLFFAPKARHNEIVKSLPLVQTPFKFEPFGTKIIYSDN